jgi:hypothetical protein
LGISSSEKSSLAWKHLRGKIELILSYCIGDVIIIEVKQHNSREAF